MNTPCLSIDLGDDPGGGLSADRASACPHFQAGGPVGVRPSEGRALEQALERHITQRTWGRLQLRVRLEAGRVVIQGRSPTNYLKQLALAAVREVLPSTPVELGIRVAQAGALSTAVPAQVMLVP